MAEQKKKKDYTAADLFVYFSVQSEFVILSFKFAIWRKFVQKTKQNKET